MLAHSTIGRIVGTGATGDAQAAKQEEEDDEEAALKAKIAKLEGETKPQFPYFPCLVYTYAHQNVVVVVVVLIDYLMCMCSCVSPEKGACQSIVDLVM